MMLTFNAPPAQKRNKTCLEPSTCNANPHPQQLSQAQTATGPCIPAVENMTVGETFVVNTVEEVLVHIKDFGMKHNFKVSQLRGQGKRPKRLQPYCFSGMFKVWLF